MHEFFDAVRLMKPSTPVVVVGSAPAGDPIQSAAESLAAERDSVRLLGHVSDDEFLHALWSNAGVYFHGHSVGGTNPALVQAMACGAAVVARDTVFNHEVLGDSGAFASPDPSSINQRLSAVLHDREDRADLSSRSRERAEEHYSWEQVLAAYEGQLSAALVGSCPSEPSHQR